MTRRGEQGQATVLSLVFLVVLLGMAALVLDLGSWYRSDRATQSTADAAALAGAQALPQDPASAATLAQQYTAKNGGGTKTVAISSGLLPNDTVKVTLSRPSGGVFTKLFGVRSVTVGSHATARASLLDQAKFVAPIGVNLAHPKLKGSASCPCFGAGNLTTLPLGKTGAPGAFDVINVDGSRGGTGPGTLSDWILHGLNAYMPLGNYYSDPGAKWNSSQVGNALDQRIGTELLFPVYDKVTGNGANAQYHVVGWVGFHLTAHSEHGSSGSLTGWFTEVVWTGIAVTKATTEPNLGARTVNLID
jgi:Flp pilus assembly protein TadG